MGDFDGWLGWVTWMSDFNAPDTLTSRPLPIGQGGPRSTFCPESMCIITRWLFWSGGRRTRFGVFGGWVQRRRSRLRGSFFCFCCRTFHFFRHSVTITRTHILPKILLVHSFVFIITLTLLAYSNLGICDLCHWQPWHAIFVSPSPTGLGVTSENTSIVDKTKTKECFALLPCLTVLLVLLVSLRNSCPYSVEHWMIAMIERLCYISCFQSCKFYPR